MGHKPSKTGF